MSSGGEKSKQGDIGLTNEDLKRRDDFLKSINDDTTISDQTRKELAASVSDEALNKKLQGAADANFGTKNFEQEAYRNADRIQSGGAHSTRGAVNKSRQVLTDKLRGETLDKIFSSSTKTFEQAQEGLGGKFKSRQLQKKVGELTREQPGLLQTRTSK